VTNVRHFQHGYRPGIKGGRLVRWTREVAVRSKELREVCRLVLKVAREPASAMARAGADAAALHDAGISSMPLEVEVTPGAVSMIVHTRRPALARQAVRHASHRCDIDLDPDVRELKAGHTRPFQRQLAPE
jgi:hypothetical protein